MFLLLFKYFLIIKNKLPKRDYGWAVTTNYSDCPQTSNPGGNVSEETNFLTDQPPLAAGRFMNIFNRTLLAAVLMAQPGSAMAQMAERSILPEHVLDFIYIRLVDDLAPRNDKDDYLAHRKSIIDIANSLRDRPEFLESFTEFMLKRLKITEYVNWYQGIVRENYRYFSDRNQNEIQMRNRLKDSGIIASGIRQTECITANVWKASNTGFFLPQLPAAIDARYSAVLAATTCGCGPAYAEAPVEETPWWAKDIAPGQKETILVCQGALAANVCGARLLGCWPNVANNIVMLPELNEAVTREPGLIAAKIVQDDLSWNEVLLTTKGVADAPYFALMGNAGGGSLLKELEGPDSYPEISSDPNLLSSQKDPRRTDLLDPVTLKRAPNVWYERGSHHAGILTTPAFLLRNNGWRAYSAAAREKFLCVQFSSTEPVLPTTETALDKKPGCRGCHVVIEPLRNFWARRPDTGEGSLTYKWEPYELKPDGHPALDSAGRQVPINDLGSYEGKSGSGIPALAKIFTESPDFASCAVKQAFEYINGREMNAAEEATLVVPLVARFEESNRRLWPVILEIIKNLETNSLKPVP